MPKLCTYILTNDTGLAPNPFWGWCTLAVCTPNHQGARLGEGDWVAGFAEKSRGHRRCGDNFYSQDTDGTWSQRRNRLHLGPGFLAKDTRKPFVFVASRFWYFGRESVMLPDGFLPLVGGRGIRVRHPAGLPEEFFNWIEAEFLPGIRGMPKDNPDLHEYEDSLAIGKRR